MYAYVITRSDGKKMLIFIFKSNYRGGGGNSHLILVHLCRRYFSDPPYSCIPEADCRDVYLFMYDLYSFATHRCKYFYAMLIYQPYRCIIMGNLATYCYWCKAAPPPPRSVIRFRDRAEKHLCIATKPCCKS